MKDLSIGKKIRDRRLQRGLSLKDAAKLCGCSFTYLSQIETGSLSRNISVCILTGIGGGLNIPLDYLIGDDVDKAEMKNFFLLFDKLSEKDKTRIMKIVDDWLNEK